jgi:hypothetical protein
LSFNGLHGVISQKQDSSKRYGIWRSVAVSPRKEVMEPGCKSTFADGYLAIYIASNALVYKH